MEVEHVSHSRPPEMTGVVGPSTGRRALHLPLTPAPEQAAAGHESAKHKNHDSDGAEPLAERSPALELAVERGAGRAGARGRGIRARVVNQWGRFRKNICRDNGCGNGDSLTRGKTESEPREEPDGAIDRLGKAVVRGELTPQGVALVHAHDSHSRHRRCPPRPRLVGSISGGSCARPLPRSGAPAFEPLRWTECECPTGADRCRSTRCCSRIVARPRRDRNR